jgi:hypothetical protein
MINVVRWSVVCASLALSPTVFAECTIAEESKQLDPVEVGFCESDAVFVGTVESRLETVRAYREEGSDRTKHYRIEVSTMKVGKDYKGAKEGKVTMTSDLYDKKTGAFSFELHKEYLVFAKRQPTGEYAGATTACSVQPTLPIADAKQALERLEQHRKGTKKIDCKNIRAKE